MMMILLWDLYWNIISLCESHGAKSHKKCSLPWCHKQGRAMEQFVIILFKARTVQLPTLNLIYSMCVYLFVCTSRFANFAKGKWSNHNSKNCSEIRAVTPFWIWLWNFQFETFIFFTPLYWSPLGFEASHNMMTGTVVYNLNYPPRH